MKEHSCKLHVQLKFTHNCTRRHKETLNLPSTCNWPTPSPPKCHTTFTRPLAMPTPKKSSTGASGYKKTNVYCVALRNKHMLITKQNKQNTNNSFPHCGEVELIPDSPALATAWVHEAPRWRSWVRMSPGEARGFRTDPGVPPRSSAHWTSGQRPPRLQLKGWIQIFGFRNLS